MLETVIKNILQALYEPLGFSVLLAFLYMFFHDNAVKDGYINAIKKAFFELIHSRQRRYIFCFAFFTAMVLFRTLLNRNVFWLNPLGHVIGVWGFINQKGEFTTEIIENTILFIPWILLLFVSYGSFILKATNAFLEVACKSVAISFIFSFNIEMLQLFLRLGTWQLSDLFFNTLGGFIGGLIYWIGYKVKHRGSGV